MTYGVRCLCSVYALLCGAVAEVAIGAQIDRSSRKSRGTEGPREGADPILVVNYARERASAATTWAVDRGVAAAGNHIIPSAEKERQRAGRRTFLPFLPGLERGIMVGGVRENKQQNYAWMP